MDMEIHELRSKLTSILKEINARILDEQMKDRAPSSRESFLKPSEIIVKSSPTTKHKVALPKFDGTSLDWKQFSKLFCKVVEKDTSLTEEEKACLILESMTTPETKELVKTAIQSDNGYENGLKTLRQKYGREHTIFREHLQFLTKHQSYDYDATSGR